MSDSTNETQTNAVTKTSKRASLIPGDDIGMYYNAQSASEIWDKDEELSLAWTTKEEFKANTDAFGEALKSGNEATGKRSPQASELRALDDLMNGNLRFVKHKIEERFLKETISHYAEFGIVKERSWVLPTDRQARLLALEPLIAKITEYNFVGENSTAAFWQPIYDRYKVLMSEIRFTKGDVSMQAGEKKVLRVYLKKALNSLVLIIKANYPDTFEAKLRQWGFFREANT